MFQPLNPTESDNCEYKREGILLQKENEVTFSPTEKGGLCFRCEHRAKNLEGNWQPRHECGESDKSVHSCYMFDPVQPITVIKADPSDKRPALGPRVMSARVKRADKQLVMDMRANVTEIDKGNELITPYWMPIGKREVNK